MKIVKLAAVSLNQIPLNWNHNKNNIISAIKEAQHQKVDILCLPELCITGYGVEDFFHSRDVLNKAKHYLNEIIQQTKNIIVSVGLPISHKGATYNCSALIANKTLLGYIAKRNLAGDGNHYEGRWFSKWPDSISSATEDGVQIGDIYFNINGIKIGQEICEDSWTDSRPGISLSQEGVDVILNPSASHFAFNKDRTREHFIVEGSRAFNCTYVYANLLGNESGRLIFDGDCVIASGGKIISSCSMLSYKDRVMTTAVVDIDTNRTNRARTFSHRTNVSNTNLCVSWEDESNLFTNLFYSVSENNIRVPRYLDKNQQFEKAVGLGLFDYLRKSKSQGFIISLSGGADSATLAFLIYFMVNSAIKELGLDEFKNKLSHINLSGCNYSHQIMEKILTCVYQKSYNSSDTTLNAAKQVASSIGATFYNIDVGDVVDKYTNLIQDSLNKKLTWENDDITLQNIQARVRSPSAWMYANIEHKLLLTTSNRSESAVWLCNCGW